MLLAALVPLELGAAVLVPLQLGAAVLVPLELEAAALVPLEVALGLALEAALAPLGPASEVALAPLGPALEVALVPHLHTLVKLLAVPSLHPVPSKWTTSASFAPCRVKPIPTSMPRPS